MGAALRWARFWKTDVMVSYLCNRQTNKVTNKEKFAKFVPKSLKYSENVYSADNFLNNYPFMMNFRTEKEREMDIIFDSDAELRNHLNDRIYPGFVINQGPSLEITMIKSKRYGETDDAFYSADVIPTFKVDTENGTKFYIPKKSKTHENNPKS